ncbi:AAR082Wp [Eremothecium gossypii ATCC 10895]|uniref:Ammonium transporter n=1 Tax=Eremothecium gossypii (strain ATCC 10895 / CBS 109.51 / FGSC 9923 / NRRL Y-1056) TaxID=284811 RepID=Q75EJ7_EREGS|nr:AAR082Wp [Eremothecium gossypii ATCC 10895]AAS50447.1 AAR082Wp [Eremothecium gossypii ATCC 10895]AEY94733.1 FAAR082Wp [Eremothecium gossypii FDAG1]
MVRVLEEKYDGATVAFTFMGSALVFVMVPGLGFLYSGLARRKSALALIWVVFSALIVGIVQWYMWGFSLAFSKTAVDNKFIGNLNSFGLRDVYGKASPDADYPELVFAVFQGLFMCVTLAIIAGATAERGRLLPHMVFLFLFATVVYCPVAYWVWSPGGWAAQWGVLDWAGGGPVEILSGVGGFVYSYFLGARRESLLINFRPHNVSMVTLGTSLLWFGWLGFNGCTSLSPNLRSVYAFLNSMMSAAVGGMAWCVLDFRLERKWSTVGLCSGVISGLVAATPSSGCIPLYASLIQGVVAGVVCNFATKLKYYAKTDDSMDILAEHGIAGIIGLLFNAVFAADWVVGLDGSTEHDGGWLTQNWPQMYKQIAYIVAVSGYSILVTSIICYVLNCIPGMQLRASEAAEERGMDEDQIGEFAYDYVEVRRDYFSWGVQNDQSANPSVASSVAEKNAPGVPDDSEGK